MFIQELDGHEGSARGPLTAEALFKDLINTLM
jgi:hypothetical protein